MRGSGDDGTNNGMNGRIFLLVPLLLLFVVLSLSLGSIAIPPGQVVRALLPSAPGSVESSVGDGTADASTLVYRVVVRTIRAPRTLMAIAAGSALSLAGLLMQTVFRNALAGPGVLGVTSGAGLGVAIVLLGSASLGAGAGAGAGAGGLAGTAASGSGFAVGALAMVPSSVAAVLGASAVLGLALLVNRVVGQPVILLVLGLLFGYAASAGTTLLMASSPAEGLERYVVWSFGSFAVPPGIGPPVLALGVMVVALGLTVSGGKLDALLLGQLYAES